ncbi:unannotated protein [freshwater metagenome]|uniref:Unannotated protein n=1 Tax=freshwater metagenome TaxID=449393 RepID=A0A6J6LY41_9ZZZZ
MKYERAAAFASALLFFTIAFAVSLGGLEDAGGTVAL